MNDDLKRITILHSNDIHGQFTGETGFGSRIDDRCIIRGNVGGLALEVKSGKRKIGLLG